MFKANWKTFVVCETNEVTFCVGFNQSLICDGIWLTYYITSQQLLVDDELELICNWFKATNEQLGW